MALSRGLKPFPFRIDEGTIRKWSAGREAFFDRGRMTRDFTGTFFSRCIACTQQSL